MPNYESWDDVTDSVEEWDFEVTQFPILNCIGDTYSVPFGFPHDDCNLILDYITTRKLIEDVLHCLFLLFAQVPD